jgi:2-polyprenyl-3-methyl-5-hydroxy-6-metoxy-1,4-benzoquinol methylase
VVSANITKKSFFLSFKKILTDNFLSVNALTLSLKTPYDFYRSVAVERINSESRVLEIAAGMGENTEFLLATGATVCAIDISEHSLSHEKTI